MSNPGVLQNKNRPAAVFGTQDSTLIRGFILPTTNCISMLLSFFILSKKLLNLPENRTFLLVKPCLRICF